MKPSIIANKTHVKNANNDINSNSYSIDNTISHLIHNQIQTTDTPSSTHDLNALYNYILDGNDPSVLPAPGAGMPLTAVVILAMSLLKEIIVKLLQQHQIAK
ncbi:hypothetical protein GY654_17200 [Vibrio parahaemolyticus]|nr:hypothetical protein [Vibrio parahaemolyticus]